MHNILGDVGNYNLEIVDYKQRAKIPFFIDTYKKELGLKMPNHQRNFPSHI
jgi:hypothetical protein